MRTLLLIGLAACVGCQAQSAQPAAVSAPAMTYSDACNLVRVKQEEFDVLHRDMNRLLDLNPNADVTEARQAAAILGRELDRAKRLRDGLDPIRHR